MPITISSVTRAKKRHTNRQAGKQAGTGGRHCRQAWQAGTASKLGRQDRQAGRQTLQACTTGMHCWLAPQAAIAGRHGRQAWQIGPARRQKGVQETPYTVKVKKKFSPFMGFRLASSSAALYHGVIISHTYSVIEFFKRIF